MCSEEELRLVVKNSDNFSDVLRKLNYKVSGGSVTNIKRRIKEFNIDYSHFTYGLRHYKGGNFKLLSKEEILIKGKSRTAKLLRRALKESNIKYKCKICKNNGTWNGRDLCLEIDHIDGDNLNNLLENLRYLCPNCHSQTPTHRTKNRKLIKK